MVSRILYVCHVGSHLMIETLLLIPIKNCLKCLLHSSLPDGTGFDVRRWDAGVGFGADFIVGHFVIGPEVQYGLTRLTKPGSDHNTTYALTLGYRF